MRLGRVLSLIVVIAVFFGSMIPASAANGDKYANASDLPVIGADAELFKLLQDTFEKGNTEVTFRIKQGYDLESGCNEVLRGFEILNIYSSHIKSIQLGVSNNVFIMKLVYDGISATESKEIRQKVDKKIAELIKSIIKPEMTEVEKVKALHDWLIDNIKYKREVPMEGAAIRYANTPEELLTSGSANALGYASTLKVMLDKAGIPNDFIIGRAFGKNGGDKHIWSTHAWNKVKLGSKYYNLDAAWDDTENDKTIPYFMKYQYFLVSDEVLLFHKANYGGYAKADDNTINLGYISRTEHGDKVIACNNEAEVREAIKNAISKRQDEVRLSYSIPNGLSPFLFTAPIIGEEKTRTGYPRERLVRNLGTYIVIKFIY